MNRLERFTITSLLLMCLLALLAGTHPSARQRADSAQMAASPSESVEEMLKGFVDDFRHDPLAAKPIAFGVRVDGEEWTVEVVGRPAETKEAEVTLRRGFPDAPTFFFFMDAETLGKIYRGELAGLTAMGKAYSSDDAPLDIDGMEGVQPTPELVEHMLSLSFHFWTRGFPEIIRFGDKSYTRELHGGNAVLFYYQEGFRSGWFQIEPGQHVNEDPGMQKNPFPSMLIITKGSVDSRIGGVDRRLAKGEAVYIGPGVSHEFWNAGREPGEGVLLMFGEGA